MITVYLKQDNKIIRNADVTIFDELGYDDILWIDLLTPTVREQKGVETFMEVVLQTKQQIEEIESSSKYSETENAVISNTNFLAPHNDTFSVEPISFIVSEGILVSLRNIESVVFNEGAKRLQMNLRNYPTGFHLLIMLMEIRIDYDADLVEGVAKQIAKVGNAITVDNVVDKAFIRDINHLQENIMMVRENIFDRQRVLSGISRSERFPNDIYPKLSLMIKDVSSLINHADFSSERLDYMQDAAMGLINIEQTKVNKIFSVLALFFMPPTMIASIYGMNFDFIPMLDNKFGYPIALGLMVLTVLIAFFFFRWKRWL